MFAEKYGPWALIAGGSEGIGASFARKIAQQAVNVVLMARKREPLEEVAQQIRQSTNVQVRTAAVDLSAADLKDRVRDLTGDIEIGMVVYNAGAESKMVTFLDRPMDELMRVIGVNVIGPTTLLHSLAAGMRARRRGGIIIVGSMAGFAGGSRMAVYTASKAYEQMLTETLWWELKPFGIDVLMLVAGSTKTPAMARMGVNLEGTGQPVMESDEVAQEGLDNLTNGPTLVAGAHNRAAAKFMCTPDRKAAVEMVSSSADAMG
ncbi:MAG TPA: SDR family NAD(P)-dependent oxidoreductase [Candidatus Binataceae bacterium]|jgi:short-subunit dehydrogenase|nr:SDR family NAD(P)-dependent oxidoreductase [Candidatus Binataceae bacterium]